MSDERLRQLERRWRESGAVEDEAAFLVERVRSGDLRREMLELAAHCDSVGAQRAASVAQVPADLYEWTRGFRRWGKVARVRANLALAQHFYAAWARVCPSHPEPGLAIQAAQNWLDHPCQEHAELAAVASRNAFAAMSQVEYGTDNQHLSAALLAGNAAHAASASEQSEGYEVPQDEMVPASETRRIIGEALRAWALRRPTDL